MPGQCETKDDIQKMQQEAIRRAHEMKSRAQKKIDCENSEFNETQTQSTHPKRQKASFRLKSNKPKHEDIFDIIFDDSEKNLILLLILMLMEEPADSGIVIALMYLVI